MADTGDISTPPLVNASLKFAESEEIDLDSVAPMHNTNVASMTATGVSGEDSDQQKTERVVDREASAEDDGGVVSSSVLDSAECAQRIDSTGIDDDKFAVDSKTTESSHHSSNETETQDSIDGGTEPTPEDESVSASNTAEKRKVVVVRKPQSVSEDDGLGVEETTASTAETVEVALAESNDIARDADEEGDHVESEVIGADEGDSIRTEKVSEIAEKDLERQETGVEDTSDTEPKNEIRVVNSDICTLENTIDDIKDVGDAGEIDESAETKDDARKGDVEDVAESTETKVDVAKANGTGARGKDAKKRDKKKDKKKAAKEEKEKSEKGTRKSPGSFRRFVRKISQEKLKIGTPSGGTSPTTTKNGNMGETVRTGPTWAEQQLKGTQNMADMFANRMSQSQNPSTAKSNVTTRSMGGSQLNRQQSRTHAEMSANKELNKTDAANERLAQSHARQRSGKLKMRKQSSGNLALKAKQEAEANEATSGISSQLHKGARELKQQKKKDAHTDTALDLQNDDQENRELDIQFQRVLREMKVKPAERDTKYANMGQVQKYKLIVDYRAKKGWGDESAAAYIAALDKHNDKHMLDLDLSDVLLDLGSITVHLRNKPVSWTMDFRSHKGLEALTAIIIKLYHIMSHDSDELDSAAAAEAMHQAVRSVSMYMRIPESFDDAARNTNLLKTITKLLAEDDISDRLCADVLEFLAVVSLSGETGHAHALDALQFLKLVDKEQFRFQYVVKLLLKDSAELRVACMQMINSITNAPHLTVDHRVHLRNEIMAAGLRGALPTLKELAQTDEQLNTHIVLWEDNSKWDREQLHSRVKMVQLGYSNAAESYSLLLDVTKGAVAQIHLNRTIQSLILFMSQRDIHVSGRDVQVPRSAYFRLCERISQQVVLPDDGFDPQFSTFLIDSSTVQEEHVEISELATLTARLRLLESVFAEAVNCKAIDILRMCDNIGKYEKRQTELRQEISRLSKLTKFNTTNEILRTEHREKVRLINECKRAEIARRDAYEKVLEEADVFIQRFGTTKPISLGETNEGGSLQSRAVLAGALFAVDGQDLKNEGFKAGTGAVFGLVDESAFYGTPAATASAMPGKGVSLADQLKAKQLSDKAKEKEKNKEESKGIPPPPPPMGGPGAPPPPPPPPPPPGMRVAARKKAAYKIKPETKMRRINWTKVAENKLRGTFWEDIDEERHIEQMDFEELNHTFSVAVQASALKARMDVQLERDISLVSHRTAQNVSILLSKILSAHSIQWLCDRLMRCDYKAHEECTFEIWQGLARTKLEKTEIEAVTTFKGDTQKLAMPDRFLNFALNHVPGYYGRLDAIVYEHNFNGIYDTAYERISTLLLAAREIRTSTVLRDTMAAILVIGNYMNCSVKGATDVPGFQISFLTKLTSTKTADNKATLLDFLCEMLEKKGITPADLEDQIPNVLEASSLSNQAVVEDLKLLRDGMNSLKKTIKELPGLDMNDMFRDTFGRFITKSENRVEELNKEFNTMTAACTEAMTFFGADPNKMSSDEMFLQLATFLKELQLIVKKKEDAKTKAESAKRRREAAQERRLTKARQADLAKAKKPDAIARRDSAHMQMPSILADVRSGRAFTRNHDMPEIEDAANEMTVRMTQYYGPTTASMEDLADTSVAVA